MMALGFAAVALVFAVLAAHFLREGSMIMVAVSLFVPVLLFYPRKWAARVVQAALVLGAIEWAWTLYAIVQHRMAAGVPYTRTMIILGAVALLTLAAGLVFRMPRMRRRYGLES